MALLPPDPVFILRSDMGYVHSMCFANYEESYTSTLFASTESGFVYLWDLETNRTKYKQKMGESIQNILSVGQNIITQEKSGSIKTWSISEAHYKLRQSYDCYGGYCRCLLIDGKIVVPQEKSKMDVVSLDMQLLSTLEPIENFGYAMCVEVAMICDKPYVLVGYETGHVVLYDLRTNKCCSTLKLKECVTSLTFDPKTSRGICGNVSNFLQLFTIDKQLKMTLKCEINVTNEGCGVVKLRPDVKIFVCGGWDNRIRLFSWKSLRLLAVLTEHRKSITDVQFSPNVINLWNAKIMATSGADGIISLWNLYN